LKIFSTQAKSLDESFKNAPHRHYISHWFYGDRVREPEPENRVLTARRRLLAYYHGKGPTPSGIFKGSPLVSPLDGTPRLVIDYFGNKRGKKKGLGHRGIDLDGASGEPVRAIADGRVTFAGVDLLGASKHKLLTPKEAAELTNKEMGPGGLYVSINHPNKFGTIYMHLESIAVNYWDEVKAGQIIGTLGRSGTKKSGPHLHLEFRVGTDRTDPAIPLSDVLVNPFVQKATP
jgi:murein DD-endopeptidase MepM/ murein hydrolase activator NlpD